MSAVIEVFLANPAPWLSFLTTLLLGTVTAYFAWRTRQLQRAQLQQINRAFDNDLADAEIQLNLVTSTAFAWEQWRLHGVLDLAVRMYLDTRTEVTRPDLVKVSRILSFSLPEAEHDASEAIVRVHAALAALEFAADDVTHHDGLANVAARVNDGLAEAAACAKSAIIRIRQRRKELAQS